MFEPATPLLSMQDRNVDHTDHDPDPLKVGVTKFDGHHMIGPDPDERHWTFARTGHWKTMNPSNDL